MSRVQLRTDTWTFLARLPAMLAIFAVCTDSAVCQPNPVADIRFVVNTGGAQRSITHLQFSPDGGQLIAGGHDKRLLVWNVLRQANGSVRNILPVENPIFWELSRDRRGLIESFDLTRDLKHLAVAGTSARGRYGDLALFDATTLTMQLLPKRFADPQNKAATEGHIETVLTVVFSPSGKYLASVDSHGNVFVWDVATARRIRRIPGDRVLANERPVAFLSDEKLLLTRSGSVTVRRRQVSVGEIFSVDLTDPDSRLESVTGRANPHPGQVIAMAVARDGRNWVSTDRAGILYFWSDSRLVGKVRMNEQRARNDARIARNLSFGHGRLLLVNTYSPRLSQAHLEIWDRVDRERRDEVTLEGVARPGRLAPAAISNDVRGALVAGINDETNTAVVYQVNSAGKFIRRRDGKAIRHEVRGSGRPVKTVAFSDDNDLRLKFTTPAKSGTAHVFDLKNRRHTDRVPDGGRWRNSRARLNGWQVAVRQRGHLVEVLRNERRVAGIQLDENLQGPVTTWAWLLDDRETPEALVVGTALHSIFVYSLRAQDGGRLLRYYRDHSGPVNDVSVSRNRRLLASASEDSTVRLWSLEGLTPDDGFPESTAWGAVFEKRDGRVVVAGLQPDGIAAARGFQLGDAVTEFQRTVGRDLTKSDKIGTWSADQPDALLKAIRDTVLWDQVTFVVTRQGEDQPRRLPLVPGWEPLATLFVNHLGEWALWTPRGFYDASVQGDRLFGWVVNAKARGGTPRFFKARQFREDFEKPEVLKNLFEVKSRPRNPAPPPLPPPPPPKVPPRSNIVNLSLTLPKIVTVTPLRGEEVGDGPMRVTADIEFTDNPDNYRVRAAVNSADLGQPLGVLPQRDGVVRYVWNYQPVQRENLLVVRAERIGVPEGIARHDDRQSHFTADIVKPPTPRVFLVGIAVAQAYPAAKDKLRYSVADVTGVLKTLSANSDPAFYTIGAEPILLVEGAVTTDGMKQLSARLSRILHDATPRDLLVVAVSGHGTSPQNNPGYTFISASDFIPWEAFENLARNHRCKKLFILDTCHSGDAAELMQRRKKEQRTLSALNTVVAAASDEDQESLEPLGAGDVDHRGAAVRNSYYTHFLLQGLKNDAADGYNNRGAKGPRDGQVQLVEALHYAETEVPVFASTKFRAQNPRHSPIEAAEFLNIRIRRNVTWNGIAKR